MNNTFTVFTKPWRMPLPELGAFVKRIGFDGIELPVRPGYQVEPSQVERDLPRAVKMLAEEGIRICSIAGTPDEPTMAACAATGIPIIRVMAHIGDQGYLAAEAAFQREYDALLPLLAQYGITLGVQNHCDRFVSNAMGLRHLIEKYPRSQIGAVWDAAHAALNGEDSALGLDIVWSHLCMVNLKNAYWRRKNGPEAEDVAWYHYWTTGRQGLASWPTVADVLCARGYAGPICLTAEYSDESSVDRLIAEDLAYAKALFAARGE